MGAGEIIALVVLAIVAVGAIVIFLNQRKKVIEWLKWAVTEAEKEYGSKTGQLKLRQVYDWYIDKFPVISTILPFSVFSSWVDVALKTMKEWIDVHSSKYNPQITMYIESGEKS